MPVRATLSKNLNALLKDKDITELDTNYKKKINELKKPDNKNRDKQTLAETKQYYADLEKINNEYQVKLTK